MISDCHGAPIVGHGCPIGSFKREDGFHPNEGKYCAACALPCLEVDDQSVLNSPENFTESVIVTKPLTIHLSPGAARELLIDSIVDEIAEVLKKRLAEFDTPGVQYKYDTDEKKVLAI
jgi:hypothetical protein